MSLKRKINLIQFLRISSPRRPLEILVALKKMSGIR